MDNIGKIITDYFCSGFFGRDHYDCEGAIIVGDGPEWIVIKKENGVCLFGDFQTYDWDREEAGQLTGRISNLKTMPEKQELIDKWCQQI